MIKYKCKHCGNKYNTSDSCCPFCGVQKQKVATTLVGDKFIAIFTCIFIALCITFIIVKTDPVNKIVDKLNAYISYQEEIAISTSKSEDNKTNNNQMHISPKELTNQTDGKVALPELNIFKNNIFEYDEEHYSLHKSIQTPVDSDKKQEILDLAMVSYDRKDWEQLSELFCTYRLYSLPREVFDAAQTYAYLTRARESYHTIQSWESEINDSLLDTVKYLLFDSCRIQSLVNIANTENNVELYDMLKNESEFYLRDVCGFEPSEIDYAYIEKINLAGDYYGYIALQNIYGTEKLSSQTDATKDKLISLAQQLYNEKNWESLKYLVKTNNILQDHPEYYEIVECYEDLLNANYFYNQARSSNSLASINDCVDSMLLFTADCKYYCEKALSNDLYRNVDNFEESINDICQYIDIILYDVCEFDQEDVENILKLDFYYGDEWSSYVTRAQKIIEEKVQLK